MTIEATERTTATGTRSSALHPIVPGFHPDPSVCRVGEDYWLVNSSFEYLPGLPLRHSTDLVHWRLVGNILTRPDQLEPGVSRPSGGIFAPTIRHHDGVFWVITTDIADAGGQLLLSATDPEGEWSPARRIEGIAGIDPDLAWDEDGVCHVTWCAQDGIAQAPVDLERAELLAPPRIVWNGTGLQFPEGPHLYRIDGWWYLLIAEGGTERGHAVTIGRSRSISGPFEAGPANPILSHRSSSHAVQNTGHADLVETPDGGWALVHLGVRPRGTTPMFHVNGRETFLAGVRWQDGWPAVEEGRHELPEADGGFEDRFEGDLHARWASPGAALADFVRPEAEGVRVLPAASPNGSPALLAARAADPHWTAEVEADGDGALRLRMDDRHWCEVLLRDGVAHAVLRIGPLEQELGAAPGATLRIRSIPSETAGPDDLELGVDDRVLARFDGRYLSTEVAGGFTGRFIGVRGEGEGLRVRSFRYAPAAG